MLPEKGWNRYPADIRSVQKAMAYDSREMEQLIQAVTRSVMQRLAKSDPLKQKDPSGVLKDAAQSVKCEPFQGRNDVRLKDIVTLEESPRIGAGIMEVDHADFPWTLTYDEFDYIIEGTLEIEVDGRVISGNAGDILHIPKNTAIHFRSPGFTRFAYFVYPADWESQS